MPGGAAPASWVPGRPCSPGACGLREPTARLSTRRISPERPTSPRATIPSGSARSFAAEAIARASARSAAGSPMRTPPTEAAKTSASASLTPPRRSTTASHGHPLGVQAAHRPARRSAAPVLATRACTSASAGGCPPSSPSRSCRGPARTAGETNSADGGHPDDPASPISKHPISSAGPKRFLTARTRRSVECRPRRRR